MGAMVAYTFAANYPEATAKVALWDGGPFGPSHATMAAFPPPGAGNTWWYPLTHADGLPAKLLAGRFRPVIDWDVADKATYPPLTMPVQILDNSFTLPFLRSELVANVSGTTEYVTIEDTGHNIAEQPEALAAELEKFFT